MSFIALHPVRSRDYSEETLRRLEAVSFAPGERVRLREEAGRAGVPPSLPADGLVVQAVQVGRASPSVSYDTLRYRLEGVPGWHDATLFEDAREHVSGYGVLFGEEGRVWAVLLDGPGGLSTSGAIEVSPVAERRFAMEQGIGTDITEREFFSSIEDAPLSGEIQLLVQEDGSAVMEALPWQARPSRADLLEACRCRDRTLGEQKVSGRPLA